MKSQKCNDWKKDELLKGHREKANPAMEEENPESVGSSQPVKENI